MSAPCSKSWSPGRVVENGDVAIAMIEAGAGKNAWHLIYDEGQTKPDEGRRRCGLEAAKPFIKVICEARAEPQEDRREGNQGIPALPGVH